MSNLKITRAAGCLAAVLLAAGWNGVFAQSLENRVQQEINPNSTIAVPGTVNPRIAARYDTGRLQPATQISGITMAFRPTAAQKAELDALVKAQQTPGNPEYHQWLTPSQYASRFGLSDSDLARIEGWLESQGFNIDRISNSRTSITFSGTASQVETAFQTEMHHYLINGTQHFANATNISIPSALSGIVGSVRHLSDFRPRPQVRYASGASRVRAGFTAGGSDDHFMTPKDVATVYDINPAYNSGYTGTGQTIAVVGQSEISASDIEAFQSAAGLTVKDPTMTLVPSSGTAAVSQGDEAESDLDVEYAGGIAKGATINFVYVGNNQNYSVYDALRYAVDNKLASVISISYGTCEAEISSSDYSTLEGIMEQAASQGQSIVASSGDDGSTACFDPGGNSGLTTAQQEALSVNYPASSAYAVGVGGTEFPSADVTSGNSTYWQSSSGSDVIGSALSYIPEQVWNDDSAAVGQQYGAANALSSGGGGVSTLTTRPSWQTGVAGISSGTYRLVPDVSLDSSPANAPYLYCTSDTSSWSSGQKASCNSGFRDSATKYLTAGGGTSFAAPIFAGMLAIINQKENSTGQGAVNSTLYGLAASASTYAEAFHDITSGNNKCTAGSTYCSTAGASEYAATADYDEATGLGSVDLYNLLAAWPAGPSSGSGGGTSSGTFTLSATSPAIAQGSSGASAVTITSQNSYAGTVGFTISTPSSSLTTYGCYTIGNTAANAGSTATATLTIYTAQSACSGLSGAHSFARTSTGVASSQSGSPLRKSLPFGGAVLAGVLLLGFRRPRGWSLMGCLLLAAVLGFSTGCGSSSNASSTSSASTTAASTEVAKGSYSLTLTGTDTSDSAITAATTLTVTVD